MKIGVFSMLQYNVEKWLIFGIILASCDNVTYIIMSYHFEGSSNDLWVKLKYSYLAVMPRLHLLRSSYDLLVYDFLYDFFGIVGSYKLRRMCFHCLRSPYDFFLRQTRTNLTENLRISYNHRVIFTTSLYKSHDARTTTLRKS